MAVRSILSHNGSATPKPTRVSRFRFKMESRVRLAGAARHGPSGDRLVGLMEGARWRTFWLRTFACSTDVFDIPKAASDRGDATSSIVWSLLIRDAPTVLASSASAANRQM